MEGDVCKKYNSARRRRQEMRRLWAADGSMKRIRNRDDKPKPEPQPDSSSSWSPPSSSSSSPSDSSSDGDAAAAAEVGGEISTVGSVSLVGRRREMEDAVAVARGFVEGYDFYGVYDGHGGARVAECCRARMHAVVAEAVAGAGREGKGRVEGGGWGAVMAEGFARMDEEVGAEVGEEGAGAAERTVGSTAVVAVVGRDEIVVANCGDSRAVLCRGGVAVPLSSDHKPDRPDEMERVEAAGGRVINWGGYRVLGVLATSRSIGDYYLKPFVTSEPEVTVTYRTEKDEFLILASDGLWDAVPNEVACRITRQCLSGRAAKMFPEAVNGSTAAEAAALLAELAMSRGSKDNISIVIIVLKKLGSEAL